VELFFFEVVLAGAFEVDFFADDDAVDEEDGRLLAMVATPRTASAAWADSESLGSRRPVPYRRR
jgi:hypothetical protein